MTLNTYKDIASCQILGIESLPAHWSENKLGYLFNLGKGLTITKQDLVDEGVPCLNYGEVHSKYGFEVNPTIHPLKCVPKSYLQTNLNALLESGDFVFADTSEDIEGVGNFSQLVSKQPTFAGYHTIIARPSGKIYPRFFAYLFHSEEFRNQIRLLVKGVKVFSISQGILKNASVWLPAYEEQQQIAQFLDYETAKIDALIDEQKRLIELLKEKRQAVISHAVTKGLNPNAPMKDSGVEWLGEVPKHWNVVPLKHIAQLNPSKSGCTGPKSAHCTFIPMEKLKTNSLELDESRVISDVYSGYTYFRDGDVLFAKVTPCFENRNTAIADNLINGIGFGSSEINVFRPGAVTSKFLYYRLLEDVLVNYWTSEMTGAGGLKRVPSTVIENYLIALPSTSEQENITSYLDDRIQKMNELSSEAKYNVELLKERRSALISAAVTGKIDVRNWQPPAGSDTVDSNTSVQTERHHG